MPILIGKQWFWSAQRVAILRIVKLKFLFKIPGVKRDVVMELGHNMCRNVSPFLFMHPKYLLRDLNQSHSTKQCNVWSDFVLICLTMTYIVKYIYRCWVFSTSHWQYFETTCTFSFLYVFYVLREINGYICMNNDPVYSVLYLIPCVCSYNPVLFITYCYPLVLSMY